MIGVKHRQSVHIMVSIVFLFVIIAAVVIASIASIPVFTTVAVVLILAIVPEMGLIGHGPRILSDVHWNRTLGVVCSSGSWDPCARDNRLWGDNRSLNKDI